VWAVLPVKCWPCRRSTCIPGAKSRRRDTAKQYEKPESVADGMSARERLEGLGQFSDTLETGLFSITLHHAEDDARMGAGTTDF